MSCLSSCSSIVKCFACRSSQIQFHVCHKFFAQQFVYYIESPHIYHDSMAHMSMWYWNSCAGSHHSKRRKESRSKERHRVKVGTAVWRVVAWSLHITLSHLLLTVIAHTSLFYNNTTLSDMVDPYLSSHLCRWHAPSISFLSSSCMSVVSMFEWSVEPRGQDKEAP